MYSSKETEYCCSEFSYETFNYSAYSRGQSIEYNFNQTKETEPNESQDSVDGIFYETIVYNKLPWSGYRLLQDLQIEVIYKNEGLEIVCKNLYVEIVAENKDDGLIAIFEHIIAEYEFLSSLEPDERKDGMADIWEAYSKYIQPV